MQRIPPVESFTFVNLFVASQYGSNTVTYYPLCESPERKKKAASRFFHSRPLGELDRIE
jgi:hypothetical protein